MRFPHPRLLPQSQRHPRWASERALAQAVASLMAEEETAAAIAAPLFDAPLTSSVALRRGQQASAHYTRASVATVIDHERMPRHVLSGEVRFSGARRGRNTITTTSWDISHSAWTKTNSTVAGGVTDPLGGTKAFTVTATAPNGLIQNNGAALVGDVTTASIWIKRRTGTGAILARFGILGTVDITSQVTTSWRRVSGTNTQADAFSRIGIVLSTSGDEVDVAFGQVENVTGQANLNPSEYISVGDPKLNMLLQTGDISASPWINIVSPLIAADGTLGGEPAWAITDDDAAQYEGRQQNVSPVPNDTTTYRFTVRVKKTSGGTAPVAGVNLVLNGGAPAITVTMRLNTDTGAKAYGSDFDISDGGDHWKISRTITNNASGNTVLFAALYGAAAAAGGGSDSAAATGTNTFAAPQYCIDGTTAAFFPVGNVYPFHGACVDGVKYFEYENGNTVANNVVTEAVGAAISQTRNQVAYLPGTAGSYFSTTDPAVRIFGSTDLDIRLHVCPDDWTPTALQILLAKWNSGVPSLQYIFYLDPAGTLTYIWSSNGLVLNTITTSTAAVSAANGEKKWVRLTHDVDNGAGGNDVKFWTSDDGIVWTQLGNTVTNVGATTIADTERPVWIGAHDSAAANTFNGTIYRAQVRRGIDGDVAVDLNPNDWGNGGWVSSVTGAEWEMNGGAIVHNSRLRGYLQERTSSLALASIATGPFAAGYTDMGTPTRAADVERCGDFTLDEIGDDAAGALEGKSRVVAFTGDGQKSISFIWKAGTSVSSVVRLLDTTAPLSRLIAQIVPVNGFPVVTTTVGSEERPPEPLSNGRYRLFFLTTAVTAVNNNQLEFYPATDAATFAVAATGTVKLGGVQCENGLVATSLAISSRAADVLEYRDFAIPAEGSIYAEYERPTSVRITTTASDPRAVTLTDGTPTEALSIRQIAASSPMETGLLVIDGGTTALPSAFNFVANTTMKAAARYATNNTNVAVNGTLGTNDTTCTLPTVTRIHVGHSNSGSDLGGNVRNVRLWNTLLPDTTLQALSQQSTIPLSVMDGLQGWFVKGKGVTQTGAGASQWADYSGKGHHLLQATDTNRPRYATSNALMLPGTAGAYASTPNAVANSITGDIDIRVRIASDDWTPGSNFRLLTKGGNAYEFLVSGAGQLQFNATGVAAFATSTAALSAHGAVDGVALWARMTRRAVDGVLQFFTSNDGVVWTQLGADVATTAGPLPSSNDIVAVGAAVNGLAPASGCIFRAQVYNGIDGTLAVDFNPADYGNGWVSSTTGEEWTMNGGAIVHNSFLKGYLAEQAASLALVALDASSFSAGWTDVGTPTRVANPLRCGDWRLDELGDDAAGTLEGKLRAVAFTGDGVKSISLLWKAGTSTSTLVRVLDTTGAANRLLATIVPVAGFPFVVPTTGTEERPPEPLGNGVYRLFFATTAITAVNNNQLELYPATDAALSVAPTGTVYLGGVQCENQTFASSLSTAARAADVLEYRGAYIPGEGTLYVEVVRETLPNNFNGRALCISDGTGNEKVEVMHSAGAATASLQIMDGGVQQVPFIQVQAFMANSVGKIAARYATNNSQLAVNGQVTGADTVCTMPTTNEVEVGQIAASNHINGHIRNARILPVILNDATLQALTRQSTIPLPIMDGLQGWFVKGKGVTQTGAGVSQWADYSGKGHHLLQAADTNRPRYATSNALMCPGVAGAYASTPDSVAASITGDIDIRVFLSMDDWTPAGHSMVVGKIHTAGQYSYDLYVEATTGNIIFRHSQDGTAIIGVASSVATGVTDGVSRWLRVTRAAASGDVKFFLSVDGTTWSQLGITRTTSPGNIFNGSEHVTVGASGVAGTSNVLAGRIFRAIVKNGIDGPTVVDFNPADTTDGDTSFPSLTTGETWTINGTAYLYGNPGAMLFDGVDNLLKCGAFTFNQPETVYTLFKQVTWTLNDIIHDGNASGTLYLYQSAAQPNIRINAGAVTTANTNLAMNTYGVVASVFNGASSLTQVNDTTPATGDCGAGNAGGFTLGASGAAGSFSNIQVEAVLVFSGAHDAAQRAAVYNYLRNFHTPGTP